MTEQSVPMGRGTPHLRADSCPGERPLPRSWKAAPSPRLRSAI